MRWYLLPIHEHTTNTTHRNTKNSAYKFNKPNPGIKIHFLQSISHDLAITFASAIQDSVRNDLRIAHVERQFYCHFLFLLLWHTPSLTKAGVVDDDDYDVDSGSCNLLPQNFGESWSAGEKLRHIYSKCVCSIHLTARYETDFIHTLMRSIFSLSLAPCILRLRWEMISHIIKNQIDFVRTARDTHRVVVLCSHLISPTQKLE